MRLVPTTLIRHNRRIKHRPHLLQLLPLKRVVELQRLAADRHREPHLALVRDAHGLREREPQLALGPRRLGRHDDQLALAVRVRRHGEVEEVVAGVVRRQPRELPLVGGAEVEHRLGVEREVRLPARDQRLLEPRTDGLAPDQRQAPVRGARAKDALRLRGAQPLEVARQAVLKGIPLLGPVGVLVARGGQVDVQRGDGPALDVQPVVVAPVRLLDPRLAAQHAAAPLADGPPRQVHEVDAAVGRLDDVAVARALQRRERRVLRAEDRVLRVHLVRARDVARARQRRGVLVRRAALRRQKVVPAVALVQVGRLDEVELRALEDVRLGTHQLSRHGVELLQDDAGEGARAAPVVPHHVDEPLAAVVVVEQRRVEAGRVGVDGLGPGAVDAGGAGDVVVRVLEGAVLALDVGVDEPEAVAVVGQARRPHAAAVRVAAHVEQALAVEGPLRQRPVGQVARVVDLHAGVPLEGRHGDVVVVAHAEDGRVGVEARQDWVPYLRHGCWWCVLIRNLVLGFEFRRGIRGREWWSSGFMNGPR